MSDRRKALRRVKQDLGTTHIAIAVLPPVRLNASRKDLFDEACELISRR